MERKIAIHHVRETILTYEVLNSNSCDYVFLSSTEYITLNIIKEYLDKNWCWNRLSRNPVITMKDIKETPDLPWVLTGVLTNPNLTMDFVLDNLDNITNTNWTTLSRNMSIGAIDVIENPSLPWNYSIISKKSSTTMDTIIENPDLPWDWFEVTSNPNVTFEFIISHPDFPWNWNVISQQLAVTTDFIEKFPDKPWNWNLLSCNYHIPFSFMCKHWDKLWNWHKVKVKCDITINDIMTRPYVNWCSFSVANIPNLTVCDIRKIGHHANNWDALSKRINVNDIFENPDLPWNWIYVSMNPTLTSELCKKYSYKLNLSNLCSNEHLSISTIFQIYPDINEYIMSICSERTDLDSDVILTNIQRPWNWNKIANNSAVDPLLLTTCNKTNKKISLITTNNFSIFISNVTEKIKKKAKETGVLKEEMIGTVLHPIKIHGSLNKFQYNSGVSEYQ